jgi:hypothetical protein
LLKLDPAVQFYASPNEMAEWVSAWVAEHDLRFLFARMYFRGQPPRFESLQDIDWANPMVVTNAVRDYSSLFVSPNAISTEVATFNQISSVNRNVLRIELPNVTYRGLTSCFWSTASQEPSSLAKYRVIAQDIRSRTNEGVWFCQEGKKKLRIQPRMRYSAGAAALLEQGVPLCGGGRMVVGRLGLPTSRATGRTKRCT